MAGGELIVLVSGIYSIRNAVKVGYPYLESIMSVLPITDEMLINDGGSDDGTLKVLSDLKGFFPDKIKLYQKENYESNHWECLDEQLEFLIDEAQGEWIIEAQSDEIWRHPLRTRELVRKYKDSKYNSFRQPRVSTDVKRPLREGYTMMTVRIVRNIEGLKSTQGGDCFYIEGGEKVAEGYTCHNVPPEKKVGIPFYHYGSYSDKYKKSKRHAKWLATKHKPRQRLFKKRSKEQDD